MQSKKVAVTLPPRVYEEAERLRAHTGESRSAVVQRALKLLLRHAEHETKIREYVEAYRRYPETSENIDAAKALAFPLLRGIPWE